MTARFTFFAFDTGPLLVVFLAMVLFAVVVFLYFLPTTFLKSSGPGVVEMQFQM